MKSIQFVLLPMTIAAEAVTHESRMRGATLGALTADALTLGTHYEYDATKIKRFYGEIDRYYAPGEKTAGETHGVGWGARNFHNGNGNGPAKKAGENTDYGDYVLLILEHLAKTAKNPHKLSLSELIPFWQKKMQSWRSWMCTQTRQALQQVAQGVGYDQLGGHSNAMSVRSPAALAYFDSEEEVVDAAITSMFTHKETTAKQGAEFFARVSFRVVHKNLTPSQAIDEVANLKTTPQFVKQKVQQAKDKVKEATDPNSALSKEEYVDDLAITSMARLWDVGKTEPIKVGKASPTEGTLPGAVYFILKYEGDFAAAAQANSAVGGDNASRSVAIGMVMGGHVGVEGIPDRLRGPSYVEWNKAQKLLSKMPLIKKSKDEL